MVEVRRDKEVYEDLLCLLLNVPRNLKLLEKSKTN